MRRLIVVTGAGSGIGEATAVRFVAGGDRVLLVGRRSNRLADVAARLRESHDDADVAQLAVDLSDPATAQRLPEYVDEIGGSVDAVVCCAGAVPESAGGELKAIHAEWLEAYAANVLTAVLAVESVLPDMTEGGSVVLYSSIAAYRGSGGNGAYGAAKNALHSYAHTLATRLGPRDINVNVIAPGYVADTELFGDRLTDERAAMLIKQTALGRPGTPPDIGSLAYFLCSPEGAYITSQILQVNGGSSHGV